MLQRFRPKQFVTFSSIVDFEGRILGRIIAGPDEDGRYMIDDGMVEADGTGTYTVDAKNIKPLDTTKVPKIDPGPFSIPRRSCYNTVNSSTVACIQTMTQTHVMGLLVNTTGTQRGQKPFWVKHDGRSFAIGSGSSKKRFYFEDHLRGKK